MPTLKTTVDLMHLFGDPTRLRLMALLSHHELTVAELTAITDLAQSRVSTHLGKLREADVLRDRRVGTSTLYAVNDASMPLAARKVWSLVGDEVDDATIEADRTRSDSLVRAREKKEQWPDKIAGQMERHYSPGRTWESLARGFAGLMKLGDVLDAGAGDGTLAALIAPRAQTVTCFDRSEKMIEAARTRLGGLANTRCVLGDFHELPFDEASFDQVLLFNVLTHAHSPTRVLGEVSRVLRPRGALAMVTLDAHPHDQVTSAYHHLHAGFRPDGLRKWIAQAGLTVDACDVTSRERREPYFQVISAFATKPT